MIREFYPLNHPVVRVTAVCSGTTGMPLLPRVAPVVGLARDEHGELTPLLLDEHGDIVPHQRLEGRDPDSGWWVRHRFVLAADREETLVNALDGVVRDSRRAQRAAEGDA